MNARNLGSTVLALTATAIVVAAAPSQQPPPRNPPDQSPPPRQPTPRDRQPGNDAASPALKTLEGSWSVTMKMPKPGDSSGGTQEIRGVATRNWILNGTVLKEEFRVTGASSTPNPDQPQRNPNEPSRRPGGPNAEPEQQDQHEPIAQEVSIGFEGMGLFSMDPQTREVSHVWADSASHGLILSLGRWDSASRTITFTRHAGELEHPQTPPTGNQPGRDNDQSDQSGQPVVTLRIVSDSEHVVTMNRPGEAGHADTYEITYTRMTGGNRPTPGTETPPRP